MIYRNFLAKELKNHKLVFTINPWATIDKASCSDYELNNLPSILAIDGNVNRQHPVLRLLGAKSKFVKSPYEKNNLQIDFTNLNPNFIPLGLATEIVNDYQIKGEVFADYRNEKEFQNVLKTMLNTYRNHTTLKDKFNNRSLSRSKKIYIFEDGSACSQSSLAKVLHASDALTIFRFLDNFIFTIKTVFDKPEYEMPFLDNVSKAIKAKGNKKIETPKNINQALSNNEFKQVLNQLAKRNNWGCENSQLIYTRATQRNIYKGLEVSEDKIVGDDNFKQLIKEKFVELCSKNSNLNPDFCSTQFDKVFEGVELSSSETQAKNTSKLMYIGMLYLSANENKADKFLSDFLLQTLSQTFNYKVRIVKGINILESKIKHVIDMATLSRSERLDELEYLTSKAHDE